MDKSVLVCVLKNKRDFKILMKERWYRIPLTHLPKRSFDYLAFYQPLKFGPEGKRIIYFAKILSRMTKKRIELLPSEPDHPRADNDYVRFKLGKIKKLICPIINDVPRRVIFGFTTLKRLLNSRNILQLYSIAPTEQIIEDALNKAKIKARPQHSVSCGKKQFRLDFAIFCQNGKIAIECDNKKAHSNLSQQQKDKIKSKTLREFGWRVIRLPEHDIVFNTPKCVEKIQSSIKTLGGLQ